MLAFLGRGQSVAVIQFGLPQNLEPAPNLARQRLASLGQALKEKGYREPWGLWWRDKHKVGMLVAPSDLHAQVLRERTDAILAHAAWSQDVTLL